ncbi:hypothetical protein [Actinomadura sp. 9N407]|uniref:hypothetical protein n=1 Tax=Actinomadura sp. 9N407 TaxID=3375154 RepID=UPI0037ADD053
MNENLEPGSGAEETTRLADALWQDVQALNQATAASQGLRQPAVHSVVASLIKTVDELHQTVQHIGEYIIEEFAAERLEDHADRQEIVQGVLRTQDALADAAARGERFEQGLSRVQEAVSALYASEREGRRREGRQHRSMPSEPTEAIAAPEIQNAEFPNAIGDMLDHPPPSSADHRSPPGSSPASRSRLSS